MYLIVEYLAISGVIVLLGAGLFGAVASVMLAVEGGRVASEKGQRLVANTIEVAGKLATRTVAQSVDRNH